MKDYYYILGIQRSATQVQIKHAYRRMVKRFHPDLHPDKPEYEEKMKDINEAYDVLSNEEEKIVYDFSFQQNDFSYYEERTNTYRNKSNTYYNYNYREATDTTTTTAKNPDNVIRAIVYPVIIIIYIAVKLFINEHSSSNENFNKYNTYKFIPLKPNIIVDSTNAGKAMFEDSDASVNRIVVYVKDSNEYKSKDSIFDLIYNNRFR